MGIRLVVVLAWLVWHPVAYAASFSVTSTNDPGTGSLRTAVMSANRAAGNNTIVINASGTIDLAAPLETLIVSAGSTLTITGPGASQLTIRCNAGAFPILSINGAVQLSGVTIQDGMNGGGNGGGIVVQAGSLVLLDSVITGNTATMGGGIYANGALTIRRSTISGNTGLGAIYASDSTTVIESTISDNHGTAIVFAAAGKTLTIDRSTISGNTDLAGIGGLQLQGGTASISNTTFSGNTGSQGGDFSAEGSGVTLSLTNVTAAGGSAPALLFDNTTSTVTLRNTLFAGTGTRCALGSLPTSKGHNLSSDTTCNLTDPSDKPGVDPMLGPLAANGGATMTHVLLAGSPALNAGDGTGLEPLDQRGKPRVQFAAADIGAVEITEPVISVQPVPQDVAEGDGFTLTVAAMNQNSATPLTYQWRKDGAPIAGATGDMWTKLDAHPADSGMYDVLVINDGGSLPSTAVAVTVTAAVVDGGGDPGDSGGCCSATGRGAWSSAVLGLALAALLGVPRRPRAAQRRTSQGARDQ